MHKRAVAWTRARGPQDPRGDGRPAARSTTGRCSRPPTSTSPRSPRSGWPSWPGVNAAKVRKDLSYLGSYGTRGVGLRRRVPAPRDLPGARAHPGLARRHRRHRQPGPRARQLPRLRRPGLPGRGARRRRPRPRSGTEVGDLAVEPLDDLAGIVAERKIAIGIVATPAPARPGGGRPARRRGRALDPQLRAGGGDRPRRACRCARSTSRSSCRSCPSTSSADGADRRRPRCRGAHDPRRAGAAPGLARLPGEPAGRRPALRRGRRRAASRPARSSRCSTPAPTCTSSRPSSATRSARWRDAGRVTVDERAFEPDDLDGAWLATDRHRRSRP